MDKFTVKQMLPVYIIVLIISIYPPGSMAQSPKLEFELIPGVDDISFGKINAMVQDSYGYLWFSDQTNHMIVRYDGSTGTKFPYSSEDPNSIGGYYPESLASGSDGTVWIGFSQGGGLDQFDPVSESFTHYRHDPNDPESLINNSVQVVFMDSQGILWLGTSEGLDRMDPEKGKFTHFRHDLNDSSSLSHNKVRSIYEDREGTLWIGTGFPWSRDEKGGLNRFERETNTFTRFEHSPQDPKSLLGNKVRAICEDSQGNFWVGTDKNGLHLMDRKTGTFSRREFGPSKSGSLQLPAAVGFMDHITFIKEDNYGFLWIGVYNHGIIQWDPRTDKMIRYSKELPAGDYNENTSWAAYVAADGIVWLASQKNKLYKADPGIPIISEVPVSDRLKTLTERGSNELWLGTLGKGLIRQNRKTGQKTKYLHSLKDPKSLTNNLITRLIVDNNNTLWVGTQSGLNRLNTDGSSFTRYTDFKKGKGDPIVPLISDIYEDSDHNLWIGTSQGLFLLDEKTDSLIYRELKGKEMDGTIIRILENPDGELIVVELGNAYKFNSENNRFEHQLRLQIPNINDAYVDKNNVLWVASSMGLWNSSPIWDTITPFKMEDTGTIIGEWSYSLIPDQAENLWLGTSSGIVRLNADRDEKMIFGSKNSIFLDEWEDLTEAKMGSEGQLYFVSSPNGYYYLEPDNFQNPVGEIRLWARDLKVNNKTVLPDPEGPINSSLTETGQIDLKYIENSFSLTFSAIEYTSDLKKRIYYKLDGYEDVWRESLSGQMINYAQVPPGSYILRYKSPYINSNEWVEKSLDIQIAKPWWLAWWAYTVYAILFVTGVITIHRYQKKRTIDKERERAKDKELDQAREIEKAYNQLQETQEQLIHSEKMASLGELTAGIAHEIKNPLNFVNNFSDVTRELVVEMIEELKNGDMEEADAIGQDVIQNLEKIVHHGQRADSIVRGMLQHSRTGDGQKEPTDLNALADEYLRLAYHGLRAKDKSFNASMETDFDPDLPKANVIPQEIGRVMLNLITNAFHAVGERYHREPEGYEPTVWVKSRKSADGIEISVRDNGGGIPDNIKDKIFQPFFTTKPTGEGTGLGLSMSYDIVTKGHGGSLDVVVEANIGSEFIINLPV